MLTKLPARCHPNDLLSTSPDFLVPPRSFFLTVNAPSPRLFFASAWDSMNLFVWGGVNSSFKPLPDGKLYNTRTGVWRRISRANAPTPRLGQTVVWSGSAFIIWGGADPDGNPIGTGANYDPVANQWTATTTTALPRRDRVTQRSGTAPE
jgi:hypothetical protein